MKVALVHDYLRDFGGAERVLRVLADMYTDAPIYTAFVTPGSIAASAFSDKKIISWKHQWLINRWNLHSPLRFLIPLIWESFDFKPYDLVISSASGYITKGIVTHPHTLHLCYCHTPPRFLYGYPTATDWQKFLPVKIYSNILTHFLRQYDYLAAQRVDHFIANSQNVQRRIKKFYRRDSTVIYPPVELDRTRSHLRPFSSKERSAIPLLGGRDRGRSDKQQNNEITNLPINYYLIVSRIVGAKGWELLLDAAERLSDRNFLIAGGSAGLPFSERSWKQSSPANIRWLGRVSDDRLWQLYENCTALLALAQDEDFGITLVEAMAAGKPVIAYAGGGYLETVIEGKTGAFFRDYTSEALVKAVKDFNPSQYKPTACRAQARKFSRQNFEQSIGKFIETKIHNSEF